MRLAYQKFFDHQSWSLMVLLLIAIFFSFFRLGSYPLMMWDESLHGELGLYMIQNGDWFNYYFGGVPDPWFAKPPLGIWAIAISYKIFGYHEFALRFPSALAMVAAFYFIFRICQLYKGNEYAFYTSLMLISVNGLIGHHVGRTGDTDALLVCFLMAASWYFLRFVDFDDQPAGILTGLCLSLAFWVKGPAAFIMLPGWVLYLAFRRKLLASIKSRISWVAAMVGFLSIILWVFITINWGNKFPDRPFLGTNSIETMLRYDLVQRFIQPDPRPNKSGYFYFFLVMDAKFGIWNYVGYGLTFFALVTKNFKPVFSRDKNGWLHLYSFLTWVSLALFLTFATTKHTWYLAPVLPFIGINIWGLAEYYIKKSKPFGVIIMGIFLISLGLKARYWGNPKPYDPILIRNEALFKNADSIFFSNRSAMDRFLYIHFRNPNCHLDPGAFDKGPEEGNLFIMSKEEFDPKLIDNTGLGVIDQDQKSVFLKKLSQD